jgi:mannuronan synthase
VRNWFTLRLAQRHALMASMALSQRLLVLTGRFSLFRTEIATSDAFVARVEDDRIRHWRLGEITLLTGDDKSTWFQVLTERRKMLYIPDVIATGLEALPAPGRFLPASSRLMVRWFGNMLRTNGRAIALGPKVAGPFTWWALVDQRLSIWTALTGPIATILLSLFYSPVFILYYVALAFSTRTFMSLAAALHYGGFSPAWPFLMYYNQVWGAALKSSLSFHLNRQSWTRQAIRGRTSGRLTVLTGHAMHLATIGIFTLVVGITTGILHPLSAGTLADFRYFLWD